MPEAVRLSRDQARRIAVRAQLLDGSASGVLETVRHLGSLQLDPTAVVAPSHLLVLWSRLGGDRQEELDRLLWEERALFEWVAFVYPVDDLPAHLSRMRRWPPEARGWTERVRAWLAANDAFRRYLLRELERRGPLLSRELEDRAAVPWQSKGWTGNRNVTQMLQFLSARGDIAVAGRRGRQRLWDLAERVFPPVEPLPHDEADAVLAERTLRALGIARRGPGRPAEVDGVPGAWVVHEEALARMNEPLPSRTTLLSPFDRLIHDRERAEDLFGFRYRMEIYLPKAKREYGYFVLPVLHRDRLVGRIDPELDRKQGVLRVNAVHWEADADREAVPLGEAVESLAADLGAAKVAWPDGDGSAPRRRGGRPS
jgi:uncharacterized protein YcaQ